MEKPSCSFQGILRILLASVTPELITYSNPASPLGGILILVVTQSYAQASTRLLQLREAEWSRLWAPGLPSLGI